MLERPKIISSSQGQPPEGGSFPRRGPVAVFRILEYGTTVRLDPDRNQMIVGRADPSATSAIDVQVNLPSVSRRHARLERGDSGLVITDLESTNGIHSRPRIPGDYQKAVSIVVKPGDRFVLGAVEILALDDATHRLTGRLETYLGSGNRGELDRALEAAANDHMIILHGTTTDQSQELARALHAQSPRSGYPFVEVTEFAGSDEMIVELCTRANGGTVYLDMPEPFPLPLPFARNLLSSEFHIRTIIATAARWPDAVMACFGTAWGGLTRADFPVCALGFPRRVPGSSGPVTPSSEK